MEFYGVRGRFLLWMAIIVGVSLMGMLILLIISNFWISLAGLLIFDGIGYAFVKIKQKEGLHKKKRLNGIYIYHHLFCIRK